MEDCQWMNIAGPAISFDDEENAHMQVNLRNITCKKVPVLVELLKSNKRITGHGEIFRVNKYVYGLQMEDQGREPEIKTIFETEALSELPAPAVSDIPALPDMAGWINLKSLGAAGDGETDDTKVLQQAIEKYSTIYVPQGLYRISETIKLKPGTVIIGLHPMATQFILGENTTGFSGFGEPKPMVEVPGGGVTIITGIGLSTGEYNYRAVACKWMAGRGSLMNDVKFVGGHGTMRKGPYTPWRGNSNAGKKPVAVQGPDPAWDTQYWSLWVTNGGGGIFKNIWTASSYATSGIYVSHTSTPSRIYALSVEHHVRNEVRFNEVENWHIYALQLEEESREGPDCQPMEIGNCRNLVFANLYMFRVIRVKTPYPWSIRTWNCENIELLNVHNYSQVKYTTDNPLFDVNSNIEVRPQEFARLTITAMPGQSEKPGKEETVKLIARGFEFAEGLCSDSKGNVYFSEQRMKRIYRWSAETKTVSLLADFPWEPLSLACDSKDNLLVVFRYNPQPGYLINGEQEKFSNPPDAAGTSFSGWGNSGFGTLAYALDPDKPDESIRILNKKPLNTVSHVYKALYPANRWRDSHDFNIISVNRDADCFVAPDSSTIIPVCYDLARSSALIEAYPGKPLYACDEYDKRTVRLEVDDKGYLKNLAYFAEKGEFSAVADKQNNVYIADGDVYKFDRMGKQIGLIRIPERPSTIAFGGENHEALFVTGRTALYMINSVNK
jgi:hypothetical protein